MFVLCGLPLGLAAPTQKITAPYLEDSSALWVCQDLLGAKAMARNRQYPTASRQHPSAASEATDDRRKTTAVLAATQSWLRAADGRECKPASERQSASQPARGAPAVCESQRVSDKEFR